MTFWSLTNSDFLTDQTFHQCHDLDTELDLYRITSGFHRAFATGLACQLGTLTLPDTLSRPPFGDLFVFQLLRPDSSNLPCLYSTFHLEYPLVLSRFYSLTACVAQCDVIFNTLEMEVVSCSWIMLYIHIYFSILIFIFLFKFYFLKPFLYDLYKA